MRATLGRLEEKYIIPIARELAIGLKSIHDAGILHRDVKGKPHYPRRIRHTGDNDRELTSLTDLTQ